MNDRGSEASVEGAEQFRIPLDRSAQSLFDGAYREHHASLVQYLRRRVASDADAADIAQEAYLRVLRYRENQSLDSLKALLFRIATNLVTMRARAARAHHVHDHVPVDEIMLAASDPPQDERAADREQLDRLMVAIQDLPLKCRQAFVLSRFHDMSYPEIAARVGISVKTVEKHITKALAICRAKVGDGQP